jgi:O-antigen/teichoic acid export membrane protein
MRSLMPTGRLRRSVLVLAGGTAAGQGIVALSSPIISRLFTPAEFGAAAAAIALVTLVLTVTCVAYNQAIPLPKEDRVGSDLVALSAIAAVAMSAVFAIVLLIFGHLVLHALDDEAMEPYLWVLVVAQLAGGLTLALTGWAIRQREFGALSGSRITQSIAMVTTQVAAGFAGMGGGGLMIGDAVGRAAAATRLWFRLRRDKARRMVRPTGPGLKYAASRYRRFPLIGSWPTLINAAALEAPLLLVVALYDPHVGGNFALASRLIAAPATLVVQSVSQVFIAEAAEQAQRDPAGLRSLFTVSLRKLIRTGVPAMALLAIPAAFLVPYIFGSAWTDAGYYLAILTPMYMAQLVTSPFGGALDVLERQDLVLVREIVRIGLMVLSVVGAEMAGLSGTGAVVMISIAGTLSYGLYGAISWHAVRVAEARALA